MCRIRNKKKVVSFKYIIHKGLHPNGSQLLSFLFEESFGLEVASVWCVVAPAGECAKVVMVHMTYFKFY